MDGSTSELEFSSWRELDLERVDAPDEAMDGPDDLEYEDFDDQDDERPGEWSPEFTQGEDDFED